MMKTWTAPVDNGWYAAFSPNGQRVVYGNGQIGVHDFITDETRDWTATRPTYHGNWADNDRFLRVIRAEIGTGYDLEWLDVVTGERESVGAIPDTNLCLCGPGNHWAAVCSGDLWLDGAVIDQVTGWPFALTMNPAGQSALAINCADGMRLYVGGQRIRTFPISYNVSRFRFDWPWINCGYAVPHRINVETGEDSAVGVMPPHGESYAAPTVDGLIWTVGTVGTQVYLVGRAPGETQRGIVVPVDWGATVTARLAHDPLEGQLYRVAVNEDDGPLVVYDIPVWTPTTPIPQPPPDPEMRDVSGTITAIPPAGTTPHTVTTVLHLGPDSGETQQVRFYGRDVNGATVRWSGPTGNDLIANGLLSTVGGWAVWARLQGKNGLVVDTTSVPVLVTARPVVEPPVIVLPPAPSPFLGLNAFFGEPIQDARVAQMLSAGVRAVRTGIGVTDAVSAALVAQLARFPQITPLYIVRATPDVLMELRRVPDGALVEMGNESNIGDGPAGVARLSPAQYAAWAESTRITLAVKRLRPYWGSISNLNPTGLAWLRDVRQRCPWMTTFSIHRYNYGDMPDVHTSPHGSRAAEMRALLSVIGLCRFRVTEIGCQSGPQVYLHHSGFLGKTKTWMGISEAGQLDYLRAEIAQWRGMPQCDGVDVYQAESATATDYGLNDLAGKPRLAWDIYRG